MLGSAVPSLPINYTKDCRSHDVTAYYVLGGDDLEFPRLAGLEAIEGSEVWVKGTPTGLRSRVHKGTGWSLRSGLTGQANLEDHLDALFARLAPLHQILLPLTRMSGVVSQVNCVLYAHTYQAGQHFSAVHISEAAKLNASIDFDIYAASESGKR